MSINDDCQKYYESLKDLEIEKGKIISIGMDEDENIIVFEVTYNGETKRFELVNNKIGNHLFEHAKIGDMLTTEKDNPRINIIRFIHADHVQVRYFDINCDSE